MSVAKLTIVRPYTGPRSNEGSIAALDNPVVTPDPTAPYRLRHNWYMSMPSRSRADSMSLRNRLASTG